MIFLHYLAPLTQNPLVTAAENGQDSVVRLLLGTNAINPNCKDSYRRTPLLLAAFKLGHRAVAQTPIDYGGELNHIDLRGATPLLSATENGHTPVVGLLLSMKEVNPNSRDYFGRTPLRLAAKNGHDSIGKQLVAAKATDINCRDLQVRRTPLEVARERGHETVVQVLRSAQYQG